MRERDIEDIYIEREREGGGRRVGRERQINKTYRIIIMYNVCQQKCILCTNIII